MSTPNAVTILTKMFFEPTAAFDAIKEKSQANLPFILLTLVPAAIFYWYFSTVDGAWFIDHMLAAQANIKPEAREAMAKYMTKDSVMPWAVGGAPVGALIAFALSALYYLIAGKFIGATQTYGQWFGFAVWTSLPGILAFPLMALQIATGHGQIGTEDLNMLTMNFLVTHLPTSNPWAGFFNGVNLTMLWTIFLAFVGLRSWTGKSTAACAAVTLTPVVLIYGIWAAKIVYFN